jgi:hypothetical protein
MGFGGFVLHPEFQTECNIVKTESVSVPGVRDAQGIYMVGSLEGATLSHWKINQLTKPT